MPAAVLAALLAACASGPPPRPGVLFRVADDGSQAARFAPLFAPERADRPENRVGTPSARLEQGDRKAARERVFVDPSSPTIYYQEVPFRTERGAYVNHVYRVHFQKVPYRLKFSHISAGRNTGLLAVVTVDAGGTPLLVTTVHTCGCYLTFLPTEHLDPAVYPPGWPTETGAAAGARQETWGERPPAVIGFPPRGGAGLPVLVLRDGTHRVADVIPFDPDTALEIIPTPLAPVADLETLPVAGAEPVATTPFFHPDGPGKGYVKGAHKTLEFLFVSWWALDAHVGHDKRYAPRGETGKVFYTSLKPWARKESDMWEFADFLRYWGWGL
ncbi:MAG: hypothetical protein HZA24_11575 [Nitrospirae bacterium]|nr:hypothetical protein [Nitrospirota bacterium]